MVYNSLLWPSAGKKIENFTIFKNLYSNYLKPQGDGKDFNKTCF